MVLFSLEATNKTTTNVTVNTKCDTPWGIYLNTRIIVQVLGKTPHAQDNLSVGKVLHLHPSYSSCRNKDGAHASVESRCLYFLTGYNVMVLMFWS